MAAASAASTTSRWQISSGRSATYINITLHVVSGDDDATVRGDRDLLLEAVANLVDNALKFTPAGGSVEFALVRDKNESIVRVSDLGLGIRKND